MQDGKNEADGARDCRFLVEQGQGNDTGQAVVLLSTKQYPIYFIPLVHVLRLRKEFNDRPEDKGDKQRHYGYFQ